MTVTGKTAADLERIVRDMAGPAIAVIESEVEAFKLSHIDTRWPVATGRSLVAWSVRLNIEPERPSVGVTLVNDVGYAQYVKSARVGKQLKRGAWRSALSETRKALKGTQKAMAEKVQAALSKHMQEAFRG